MSDSFWIERCERCGAKCLDKRWLRFCSWGCAENVVWYVRPLDSEPLVEDVPGDDGLAFAEFLVGVFFSKLFDEGGYDAVMEFVDSSDVEWPLLGCSGCEAHMPALRRPDGNYVCVLCWSVFDGLSLWGLS